MENFLNEESKGDYDFELDNLLNNPIDSYEYDRKQYWENKGFEYQIEYNRAERFAKFILEGIENLANEQKIEEDLAALQYEATKGDAAIKKFNEESRKIAESEKSLSKEGKEKIKELFRNCIEKQPEDPQNENSPMHPVWERFCIDLARDAIGKVAEGSNRVFKLYRLMLSSPPPLPTISYLLRLTRCYIWGFDSECVILCRSVLDTAFREKIKDDKCKKWCRKKQDRKKQNDYSLSDRIHAAIKEHCIDEKTKSLVDKVKLLGDKAVHEQPNFTKDAWDTICNTISVLEVLFYR